ncbi:unnamed protein product [Rhizoctonia solani]|uniref:Uncharacterized protein n=1 Tax=Rhizoctonia solani TaxID=456999 RepID=A0A8H3C279_9AGAM|nr:unnamed protein product [Rhizoctonia solani]
MSGTSPPTYKSRAPAINPFDKLDQRQFDSYVSSIQAKIKVALDPPSPEPQHVSRIFAEISRSTIASPAPSPAPLSKRPGPDTRPSSRATYTPLGAGTPNEPYELSDDDDDEPIGETPRSRSQSEALYEEEPEPLGSIQEENEIESDEEQQGFGGDIHRQEPDGEGAWDYSGEDASEQDELSEAEGMDEEEDVFIGKGKGRHPAEGPGLAGLLNGSNAHRTSISPESPERMDGSISPDNSFEAGVAQMPTLGTTSTPFISRFATRRSAHNMEEINDDEDNGSPPWEGDQSSLIPIDQNAHEGSDGEEDVSEEETGAAGTGHDTAIEVLDSDQDDASDKQSTMEIDQGRRSGSRIPDDLYAGLGGAAYPGLDELQFDDSATFPHRTFEPDSLLDDTVDDHGSMMSGAVLPKPSSLFTGSGAARTREPSESRDAEESADTAHAHDYTIEDPDDGTKPLFTRGEELEIDQPSIQQSMDYSDFIGEKSLLANQLDNSLTRSQVEENYLEVTVYEIGDGTRYYDHEGIRHFLNPEGQVYETCLIPPPRPTIQRPPDLSMIEEVTEYDMTRRMIGNDTEDEDQSPGQFNFLKGLDDTMSSVGTSILHHPPEDNINNTFDMEDIPQRPGAAMGFRARIVRCADGSAVLSESLVLADSTNESLPTERANPLSRNHSLEESMTGRNAGDLISEPDDMISEDTFANVDEDSIDSILDDDEGDGQDRGRVSALADREDLVTPVPHGPTKVTKNQTTDEEMDISSVQELPELNEKDVADALAAVAQFAQASSFESLGVVNDVPEADVSMVSNSEYEAFNQGVDDLDRLIDTTTSMTAAEEDMLAHSFSMADALQNTTVPVTGVDEVVETAVPGVDASQGMVVQSSVLGEMAQNPYIHSTSTAPEKLASEVLAEVFKGVDPVILPSGAATGTATPMEAAFQESEHSTRVEEVGIDEPSRSPTPKPTDTTMEIQESSPRRTPPTPTLSAGQSLTAPDMSIATSVSGLQPNVSIYEGSPASSTNRDDIAIPLESDVTQLPDPALPPAPTHLSTPNVSNEVPESSEVHRELSPSVMVEPPTPHARSEDGADLGVQDANPKDNTEPAVIEPHVLGLVESAQDSDPEDAAGVDELLSDGENTATDRSRNGVESNAETSGQASEAQATPTPEKRRMVFDGVELPMPRLSPRSSYITPSRLISESIISPVSDAAPPGFSPTPRKYQSLYKRTPASGPFKAASEAGSARKSSGSDQGGPAPWPLRNLTHRHTRPDGSTTGSPMTRSNCRYHKISIPMDSDDGDTQVNFIVPACALRDQETMKEQGIEDLGLSTPEEEHTRITNLAKLEPNVVNKLQALISPSLLNEGVCGYLEPKTSRSSPRSKDLRVSEGRSSAEPKGSDKEGRARSPRSKPKSRPRPSARRDDRAYRPSAEGSGSDDSTDDEPTRKRPKRRGTGGVASSVKFPTFGADSPQKPSEPLTAGAVPISKRMKRARRPADAQPFKPDPKDEESSTDDESGRSPRKRTKRQNASALRRPNTNIEAHTRKQTPDEGGINPFKPTNELKRLLSPPLASQAEPQPSISTSLVDPQLNKAEQKELERHLALGDKPGEVVDESGDHVNPDQLEPAPAMAAAHVDRSAHNEMGQRESTGKEDNASASGTAKSKKPWHRFLRF